MELWGIRGRSDRGAVIPMVAIALVLLMTSAALAIDLGRQMALRRDLQADADLISLDTVQVIDGRTTATALQSTAQAAANASAVRNHVTGTPTVTLGCWSTSHTFLPSAGSICPTPGSGTEAGGIIPNADYALGAVRITLADSISYYFSMGIRTGSATRSSVAVQRAIAEGGLGSVFAGIQAYKKPGTTAQANLAAELASKVLNATLAAEFGISAPTPEAGLGLDALSYQGIASGNVKMGALAAAAGFGSVNDMLNANMSAKQLLQAEASALRASPNAADVQAGNKIATFANSASSTSNIRLGDMIDVSQGTTTDAANFSVNALGLINGSGELINGKHFFSTTINLPVYGNIPLRVSVIEPMKRRFGHQGDAGPETAQVRLAVDLPVTLPVDLSGLSPLLGVQNFQTTLPLVLEAAKATSTFSRIACGNPKDLTQTDFRVISNGLAVSLGTVTDGQLQNQGSYTVGATSVLHGSISALDLGVINLDTATSVSKTLTFRNGATYNGGLTTNVGVGGADETHTFVGIDNNIAPTSWRYDGGVGTSVSGTLFNNLGIAGPLGAAVTSSLTTTLAGLDSALFDPLLSILGVTIAGADGTIPYVNCQAPAISQ